MNPIDQVEVNRIYDLSVPHSDGPQAQLFSIQTLVYFTLNLLTVGIYGTSKITAKLSDISLLERKSTLLENHAKKVDLLWKKQEQELNNLQAFNSIVTPEMTSNLYQGSTTLFKQVRFSPLVDRETKESFSHATFVAHLILNCLSLGIYCFIKNGALNVQHDKIRAEILFNTEQYKSDFTQKS